MNAFPLVRANHLVRGSILMGYKNTHRKKQILLLFPRKQQTEKLETEEAESVFCPRGQMMMKECTEKMVHKGELPMSVVRMKNLEKKELVD